MAITTGKSVQLENAAANPPVMNASYDEGGKVRLFYFKFTQGAAAGDAGSSCALCKLPPGAWRVIGPQSFIEFSNDVVFGASRVMDIGFDAYTDPDGATVAAALNALDNDINVAAAGSAYMGSDVAAGTAKTLTVNSRDGVTMRATVTGGTWPAGCGIAGFVAAAQA